MKKSLISLAIAAGMAVSGTAFAEATVYGNVHLSIDDFDDGNNATEDELTMNSNTSAIGVKGTEDLGNGLKAAFKVEFQIDPSERCNSTSQSLAINDAVADGGNGDGVVDVAEVSTGSSGCNAITDRDQWVGLKGGMGTVKFGTMSSNYKQLGGKVDPMYRTRLEGRGFLGTQSSQLHGGAGRTRGRMTDALQYSSPKMGGMQLVLNTTFDGNDAGGEDETFGAGFRYSGKGFMAYLDFIDAATGATTSESATKVGGKFKAGPVTIGAQFESAEDLTGSDYTFLSAAYGIDKNNDVYFSFGQKAAKAANSDSDGMAIMYNHKLSKMTNVYIGYGDRSDDVGDGNSDLTLGMRKKF